MGAVEVGVNHEKGLYGMMVGLYKTNYFPGETIIGEIKLFLKNNMQNVPQILKSLKISYSLIHREYWQNHENTTLSSISTITNTNNQSNSVLRKSKTMTDEGSDPNDSKHFKEQIIFSKEDIINLPNNNNNIQRGISIPFKIVIPEKAMPSLEFLNNVKIYAYSRTYLNINIRDTENTAKLLIFIQKMPTPLKSELTIIKSVVKKKLGFFGASNSINFQGSYPRNSYGFNEVIPLSIKLDTFSVKEPIKSITVILRRKINFLQNGSKGFLNFNEYVDDLWQNSMNRFESAQDFNFNILINESPKIFLQKKSMYIDVNSINKQNLICLLPSYEGKFIKCEYYIQIKVHFDSLLIKDPEFIMPLDIGHTCSFFVQNSMFDVNKALNNYNGTMNLSLMIPDIFLNNNININNNNNINNINNHNNYQYNFGNMNNYQEDNNNNIFYDKISQTNNNINNINNNTPQGPKHQHDDNLMINPLKDIKLEDSFLLPSLEEIAFAKNMQAAPNLNPNKK